MASAGMTCPPVPPPATMTRMFSVGNIKTYHSGTEKRWIVDFRLSIVRSTRDDSRWRSNASSGKCFSNRQSSINNVLFRLLGDVQDHADAGEGHEKRRSTVGDERQRDAFGWHHPKHNTDIDESLKHDHAGDADGEETSEGVLCAHSGARAAPEKDPEQDDDCHPADQAEFLGGYGEDEVGVRLGQIEELLLAFHQPEAGDAAGRDGDQRLDHVEAASLRVGVGIQESENAIFSIRHVEDQEVERENRSRESISEIAQANTGHEQDAGGDSGASDGGSEVGLEHDQAEKDDGRSDGREKRVAPVINVFCFVLEEPGQKKDQGGLASSEGWKESGPRWNQRCVPCARSRKKTEIRKMVVAPSSVSTMAGCFRRL